jgi:hypothetical protein
MLLDQSHQLGAARGRQGKRHATLASVRELVSVRAQACSHFVDAEFNAATSALPSE